MNSNIYRVNFLGTSVRVIEKDGNVLCPIVDIADAVSYSRQAIRQICIRNQDVLEDFTDNVALSVKKGRGGKYSMGNICLTHEGIIAVLFKIVSSRVKDSARRLVIINFQRWAVKTLTRVASGKVPIDLCPIHIAELFDIKPGHKLGAAVRKTAENENVCVTTIYNRLKKLRGKPYKIGYRAGVYDHPEEVAKILAYKKDYPDAFGTQIQQVLNTQYTIASINMILKNVSN